MDVAEVEGGLEPEADRGEPAFDPPALGPATRPALQGERPGEAWGEDGGAAQLRDQPRQIAKLAYEIDKLTEGDYTLVNFHADPTQIAELDRVLRINDAVKRHMIVRRPDHE